jgi:hypothetical protein
MATSFTSPSAFSAAVQFLTFRLMELHGRAPRTQATLAPATTLAQGIVSDYGTIKAFRMRALDTGTTSSATFNTVGLYKLPYNSVTFQTLTLLRTNRGSNGAAAAMAPLSAASAAVVPGDMLVIRRVTKLNTASQIIVTATVDKNV